MKNNFNLLSLLVLFSFRCLGQESPGTLSVNYISEEIIIDGVMDETVWQDAASISNFWQYFPADSIRAFKSTEVKILYNDETIYVGIYAESTGPDYVATSLQRDFSGASNDNVSVLFDTFSDGANAFLFGITPYGVQREVLISEGGSIRGLNPAWDMKWRAEVKRFDDHFVAEMAIPLTSMKFPEGSQRWRFQAYRFAYQGQEHSAWVRVPQNQLLSSLAFMSTLEFERPLGKSRTPFALIPYVNTLAQNNSVREESGVEFKVGGDAKVAIGNGMNLDITVNPDFSNLEVDDIFTNLTRFEIFLPERRQFFIDNSDLFGLYGSIYNDASPFFSRRIGLARDTAGNLIQNRIIGGARLSGKLDQNWRLGFLNIQTDEDKPNEIPSNNNTMLALQRKVSARSSIGAFFINRETFGDYEFLSPKEKFNRVYGIDYNLASRNNNWTGKFYAHQSIQPDDSRGNLSSQATVAYNDRFWYFSSDLVYIDQDFQSDLGFIPRKDVIKYGMGVGRTFYPKKGIVNKHVLRLISLTFWRPSLDFKRTDQLWRPEYTMEFRDQSRLEMRYLDQYVFLNRDFNPTRKEGSPIPGNEGYNFSQLETTYTSNVTRSFTYRLTSTLGQFFNGNAYSYGMTVGYRLQPYATPSLERPSLNTLEAAEQEGMRLADELDAKSIVALRAIPADDLLQKIRYRALPIIDGHVLPDSVAKIYLENKQNKVSMLTGWNEDDGILIRGIQDAKAFQEGILSQWGKLGEELLTFYPATNDSIANISHRKLQRDLAFGAQNYTLANILSDQGKNVFVYRFTRDIPDGEQEDFGAFHTGEVPYALNNLNFADRPFKSVDYKLSDAMASYWVNFARTGNPNGEVVPDWPAYRSNSKEIMLLGDKLQQGYIQDSSSLNFLSENLMVE